MNRIAVLMKWMDRNNQIIKNNLMDLNLDHKQLKLRFVVFFIYSNIEYIVRCKASGVFVI